MKFAKGIAGTLAFLVTIPIWYYLLYKILQSIGATELMWFLFWIYVPVGILISVLAKIAEND